MKVKVLYFASLREKLGKGDEEIELPGHTASLVELRAHLSGRGGAWQSVLADASNVRLAINQDMVSSDALPTAMIKAGDEIAFFPPVTGG